MTDKWPTEFEIKTGSSWVTRVPRPDENNTHAAALKHRQEVWDAANARYEKGRKATEDIRAARAADEQAKRDAAAREAEAKREAKNAETEALLRKRFLAAGGSPAEWEAEREDVLREHRRRAVAEGEKAEAEAQRAQSRLYARF